MIKKTLIFISLGFSINCQENLPEKELFAQIPNLPELIKLIENNSDIDLICKKIYENLTQYQIENLRQFLLIKYKNILSHDLNLSILAPKVYDLELSRINDIPFQSKDFLKIPLTCTAAKFTANCKYLIICYGCIRNEILGQVCLVDLQNINKRINLNTNSYYPQDIAINDQYALLLLRNSSEHHFIKKLEFAKPKLESLIELEQIVCSIDISPNNKLLLVTNFHYGTLYNIENFEKIEKYNKVLKLDRPSLNKTCGSFSPDSQFVLIKNQIWNIRDLNNPKAINKSISENYFSGCYIPNSKNNLLLRSSHMITLQLFNGLGRDLYNIPDFFTLSQNGKYMLGKSKTNNIICLYDIQKIEKLKIQEIIQIKYIFDYRLMTFAISSNCQFVLINSKLLQFSDTDNNLSLSQIICLIQLANRDLFKNATNFRTIEDNLKQIDLNGEDIKKCFVNSILVICCALPNDIANLVFDYCDDCIVKIINYYEIEDLQKIESKKYTPTDMLILEKLNQAISKLFDRSDIFNSRNIESVSPCTIL